MPVKEEIYTLDETDKSKDKCGFVECRSKALDEELEIFIDLPQDQRIFVCKVCKMHLRFIDLCRAKAYERMKDGSIVGHWVEKI